MNAKFFDLNKDKQDRMMNAGLKVFALNGYRKASTDEIVAEAGISKGLLFHYFGNKIGLYTFLYDYSVRFLSMELSASVDAKVTNLFDIARGIEAAKLQVLRVYPYIQQFINTAAREDVSEALLAIESKSNTYRETIDRIYAQTDLGIFASVEDGQRIAKMLQLTIDGLMAEKIAEKSYHPEMLYEEVLAYIDTCERAFCKGQG